MRTMMVNNLYDSYLRLSQSEKNEFLLRIKEHEKQEVAYTSSGYPLTHNQYQERIHEGLLQCTSGQCKPLQQICKDKGYDYDAL